MALAGFLKQFLGGMKQINLDWLPYGEFLTYSYCTPAAGASKFSLDRHEWIPDSRKKRSHSRPVALRGPVLRQHELFQRLKADFYLRDMS